MEISTFCNLQEKNLLCTALHCDLLSTYNLFIINITLKIAIEICKTVRTKKNSQKL